MGQNELVLYNGQLITLDSKGSNANWIYIKDGYIKDFGIDDGYEKYKENVKMMDLKNKYAIPGFIDSHVHLVQTGLNKLANNFSACRSIKDVVSVIKDGNMEKSSMGPVIRGVALEEIKLEEKRMPTRWELDVVHPKKILWISTVDYQITVVNTHTYKFLNLPYNIEGIERDERGIPTGVLTGRANFIARKKLLGIISDEERKEGVEIALKEAIKKGVTTINAMEGGFLFHDKDALYVHENIKKFPIDVELFFQTTHVEKVKELGLNRIGGSIFLDGSFQARTAAMELPYEDLNSTRGDLYFTYDELEAFILAGIKMNMDTTIHAVGERAISRIIKVYEEAKSQFPDSKSIMRVQHFEIPREEDMDKGSKLGIIASMTPAFEYFWGGEGKTYDKRLGKERIMKTNPFKTLIEKGFVIAGGSESDLTPIDPLLGIHAILNHHNKEERISNKDALHMFTLNGAKAIGKDNIKGKLEKGYMADICILDENPLECDRKKIKDISVLATIKSGKILFNNI
ncbi:amidohydrolase [Anaeromicrobium sediminis]|uniref:Amidohydrolase 3 domain-containing protein n=1 Tax=Anaeromicrobium sediminis TaxID=1478221 RepID=A0A267ML19_9FIRM|nr:amidohydrolase [Anaeromicrobium sediminis]PAB60294.1 hypothetical protein CCE28_05185 [Anaeromicrobium sediminis]